MRLLIKQRVFSWTDTYDVYDEWETPAYFVKAEFLTLTHQIHVYDRRDVEVGAIRERLFALLHTFEIEMEGRPVGTVRQEFALFRPRFSVECSGWDVQGDLFGWDYDVLDGGRLVAHISKELFHWGDTYVLDIADPKDELLALMLVIAIDAAYCDH